jgi:hypothetical protein
MLDDVLDVEALGDETRSLSSKVAFSEPIENAFHDCPPFGRPA